MTCPHREQSDVPANIIDLSQLDYTKPKCPFKEGTCKLCQEVLEVEKDIKETFEHLKGLVRRQQRLKTRTNNTHSPIIRDLPVEILSKIFYSCFSEEMTRDDGELAYEDVFVPLKVGAVCRTWRQVAWSSSELWTTIFITRLYCAATYVCKQYPVLERWIERSKSQPISVYVYEDATDGANVGVVPEGCDCWETTLQLLARCCDRWKNASLNLSRDSFKYIASNLKLKSPTRRMELGSDERWLPDPNNQPLQLWEDSDFSPDVIRLNRPVLICHFNIDWKHVTKVDVQGWPPGECINLLKSAPQLVSCSFREVGEYSRDSQPEQDWPVVCHTSLRSLSFQCGLKPVNLFFDNITVPSLDEFNYSYVRGNNPAADTIVNSSVLPSFFNRSHFPLTRLSLIVPALTRDYLVSLLNLVPSLVHLSMHFSASFSRWDQNKVMDYFLEHLSSTAIFSVENGGDTNPLFLPQLETLELESCSFNFPWSSLPDVFGYPSELGREGRRPLKSFVLGIRIPYTVRGLPEDVVQRLVGLQEAGVSLNYRVRSADGCSLVPVTWA